MRGGGRLFARRTFMNAVFDALPCERQISTIEAQRMALGYNDPSRLRRL